MEEDSKAIDSSDLDITPQRNPFNFSVGVRGEYDDNSNTSETTPQDAWKVSLSPSIVYTAPLDNTLISLGLSYSAIFFVGGAADERIDQHVNFVTTINHTFNDRVNLDFRNRFRYSQEPEALDDLTVFEVDGSFFINTTSLQLGVEWTPLLGTTTFYELGYFDYSQQNLGNVNSRLSNSIQHDFRFAIWPTVTLVAGAGFQDVHYFDFDRDFYNITGDLGADWQALPNLTMGARASIIYTESELVDGGRLNPGGNVFVDWEIGARSSLSFRFNQGVTATDLVFEGAQVSSTATLLFLYELTPRLTASVQGAARLGQFDEFFSSSLGNANGISNTDFTEDIGSVSLSLSYAFNRYFSANAGYTYSTRISPLPGREYDRNRVYLGVTASF